MIRCRAVVVSTLALAACGGNVPRTGVPVPPASQPASSSVAASPPAADAPGDAGAASPPVAAAAAARLASKAFAIPGASGPLSYDYLVSDRATGRVYVAVGNTGSLDVFDVATKTFTSVSGFKTEEREYKGKKRLAGPSAATIGDGVVYVGNRATSEVCAVDARALKLGRCLKLPTPTDGVFYVASAREVWVTTPRDQSITVLDASVPGDLKAKTVIKFEGEPEGYAVDNAHGVVFTNLEDKGGTVVVDIQTHKAKATWNPSCGADGPRGVAVDTARQLVFVACTDHVQVLDAGHDGAPLGRLDTGAGVDNLDYVEASGLLVVAAGKAGQITTARFDDKGQPTVVATGTTAAGARNAVADANGNVYVPDPAAATLLVLSAP